MQNAEVGANEDERPRGMPLSSHPELREAISKPGEGAGAQPAALTSKSPSVQGRILHIRFMPSQGAAEWHCGLRGIYGFIAHRAGEAPMSAPIRCVRAGTEATGHTA